MKFLLSCSLNPKFMNIHNAGPPIKYKLELRSTSWQICSVSRGRVKHRGKDGMQRHDGDRAKPNLFYTPNASARGKNNCEIADEGEKGWVHFVGIGGSGLSALAMLALKQGWRVSGSDVTWTDYMDALERAGARLHLGHSSIHLQDEKKRTLPSAVVISSAIPKDNEEIAYAHSLGISIYKRDTWLGKITQGYNLIAVSGSHGKSTTAAMLAFVLRGLGDDITAIVGANVPQFPEGGNAIAGCGPYFVLEADEYDECFLGISPSLAIVTNVEWEHVDVFPDEASVRESFRRFVMRIKPGGSLIVCGDSAGSRFLVSAMGEDKLARYGVTSERSTKWANFNSSHYISTYGLEETNDWRAINVVPNAEGGTNYVATYAGIHMAVVSLKLPGVHNILNSLAVIASVAALAVGNKRWNSSKSQLAAMQMTTEAASRHLRCFTGVSRRFQFIGKTQGCQIYDDYAHHPTEVRAVLQAARQRFGDKALWVVFQPHTYSRLVRLFQDFTLAFSDADHVIITKVYAAREQNIWNISGKDLASSLIGPSAIYIPNLLVELQGEVKEERILVQEDVLEKLICEIPSYRHQNLILITLGAGDITSLGPKLLTALR